MIKTVSFFNLTKHIMKSERNDLCIIEYPIREAEESTDLKNTMLAYKMTLS